MRVKPSPSCSNQTYLFSPSTGVRQILQTVLNSVILCVLLFCAPSPSALSFLLLRRGRRRWWRRQLGVHCYCCFCYPYWHYLVHYCRSTSLRGNVHVLRVHFYARALHGWSLRCLVPGYTASGYWRDLCTDNEHMLTDGYHAAENIIVTGMC